jgi:hypothetical protein
MKSEAENGSEKLSRNCGKDEAYFKSGRTGFQRVCTARSDRYTALAFPQQLACRIELSERGEKL